MAKFPCSHGKKYLRPQSRGASCPRKVHSPTAKHGSSTLSHGRSSPPMILDDYSTKHLRSTIVWIAQPFRNGASCRANWIRRCGACLPGCAHCTTPHHPAKTIVLNREVLTSRSEFRLRGVLVPPTLMLSDRWAILVELERTGKRKSACMTSATGWDSRHEKPRSPA